MRPLAAVRRRTVLAATLAVFVTGSVLAIAPAHAVTASAFVRVNQVGYPSASAKRAFLMASDVETGATFTVRSGGTIVFS